MKSGSSKTEDEEKNGEESINEVNNIDDQNIDEEVFRQHKKKDLIDEEPATTRVEKKAHQELPRTSTGRQRRAPEKLNL